MDDARDQNTVTEMKNAFDGLLSRLDVAEGGISELEDMTMETSQTEKQRRKRLEEKKNRREYLRNMRQLLYV